jgi:hypothetical protein
MVLISCSLSGVENRALQRLSLDCQVPRQEKLTQPVPHRDQGTGREPDIQVEVEHVEDLHQRGAEQVVQLAQEWLRCTGRWPSPARRGIGNGRFDGGPALRTPIATDCILGENRFDIFGDLFDGARVREERQGVTGP